MARLPNGQLYDRISPRSSSFLLALTLHRRPDGGLRITSNDDINDTFEPKHQQEATQTFFADSTESQGPLTDLLYRLNKAPSKEVLQEAKKADVQYKPGEHVATIDPSLKSVLVEGILPLKGPYKDDCSRLFRNFKIEAEGIEEDRYGDETKNMLDYDPDQEYEVYAYSSSPRLELKDPLGFASSVEGEDLYITHVNLCSKRITNACAEPLKPHAKASPIRSPSEKTHRNQDLSFQRCIHSTLNLLLPSSWLPCSLYNLLSLRPANRASLGIPSKKCSIAIAIYFPTTIALGSHATKLPCLTTPNPGQALNPN